MSQSLLIMGMIDLDLQGHVALKLSILTQNGPFRLITNEGFDLELPSLHQICILAFWLSPLKMVGFDFDLQGQTALRKTDIWRFLPFWYKCQFYVICFFLYQTEIQYLKCIIICWFIFCNRNSKILRIGFYILLSNIHIFKIEIAGSWTKCSPEGYLHRVPMLLYFLP